MTAAQLETLLLCSQGQGQLHEDVGDDAEASPVVGVPELSEHADERLREFGNVEQALLCVFLDELGDEAEVASLLDNWQLLRAERPADKVGEFLGPLAADARGGTTALCGVEVDNGHVPGDAIDGHGQVAEAADELACSRKIGYASEV